MTGASDAELMRAVRTGDRDAFTVIVDRHKDGLVNYLSRLTGSSDRAQDLAQETFLRLYQRADGYRERGQLSSYLYRIATNLLRSELRRERRWRLLAPFLVSTNGHAEAPPAPERLLADEAQRQLAAAVAQLPWHFRVPLVLHEIEGWTYAAIAEQLGRREGTIKSRIHRGRRLLKERRAPYWNNGGGPSRSHGETP